MKHVSIDTQNDSVKNFVLTMANEPLGSVLELAGKPVARMMPPPASRNGTSSNTEDWTDIKNERRCELIDKEIDDTLSLDERNELEDLQEQMLRYRHRVAPLPLAHARRLLEKLEKVASQAADHAK